MTLAQPSAAAGPRSTAGSVESPAPAARHNLLRQLARDRSSLLGLVLVSVLMFAALVGPWFAPHDPNQINIAHNFAPRSSRFLLGSDHLGRDTLSRLLFGARLSLGAAVMTTVLITLLGVSLGLLAGFLGGVVDSAISWVVNVLLSFPSLLLALAITAVLGPGLNHVMIALVAVWWTGYARIVRAAVLDQRGRLYVTAAASLGASNTRIVLRHVLPNIVAPIVVFTSLEMGAILLAISGLSFLGFGVSPPTAEWGAMLSSAKPYIDVAPQLMLYPGAAILLFALGFNLLGDGLRDILDPKKGKE